MLLIADSGSTKTHWELWNGEQWQGLITEGLNPYFVSDEVLETTFRKVAEMVHTDEALEVCFYGAGCTGETANKRLRQSMNKILKPRSIEIESDLLAACRATCGNHSGIVAILGTGSNSCQYDGEKITRNIAALGYALGCDEGSGNAIGRQLLKNYFRDRMPQEISSLFREKYPMERTEFLEQIYHRPNPNRYLAQFACFAYENIANGWMRSMVEEVMEDFFREQIDQYDTQHESLNIIGSVAVGFEPVLRTLAQRHNTEIGMICKEPMEGLKKYHKKCE